VSGIHLPTLKVSGSNPQRDRNKKISAVVIENYTCFFQLSMTNYAKYIEKMR
jgi:hypothetical protein